MVVALHEAEHIKGLVADTHSHFCDDIPDRTDRLVPIQQPHNYGLDPAVGQRYNDRPS